MFVAAATICVVVFVPTVDRSNSKVKAPATVTNSAISRLTDPETCATSSAESNETVAEPVSVFTVCVIGAPIRFTRSRKEPLNVSASIPSRAPWPLPSKANFAEPVSGKSITAAKVPLLTRTPTSPAPANAVTPVAPSKNRLPVFSSAASPVISAKSSTWIVTPPATRITSALVRNVIGTFPLGV